MIFLFLSLMAGCGPHKLFKNEYVTLSESPCVDGVILNIEQAGCESFYWGTDSDGEVLKIRCVYSSKDSAWTSSSFYSIPHSHNKDISTWSLFCEDRHVKMFIFKEGTDIKGI